MHAYLSYLPMEKDRMSWASHSLQMRVLDLGLQLRRDLSPACLRRCKTFCRYMVHVCIEGFAWMYVCMYVSIHCMNLYASIPVHCAYDHSLWPMCAVGPGGMLVQRTPTERNISPPSPKQTFDAYEPAVFRVESTA